MKASKFYIDRKDIAEKLGVAESQIAIGDVESDFDSITFTVFIDGDAIIEASHIISGCEIRRKRFN